MVERLLDSMILGVKSLGRLLNTACIIMLLTACGAKQVIVQGNFPEPLLEPVPLSIGVVYTDEFANHEFFDEAAGRTDTDWLVSTGAAQVEFWDTLLGGMFKRIVRLREHADLHEHENQLDAVIVPYIEDLQYTIPTHTNVKIYEIWMRYRFQLVSLDDIHDHDNDALTLNPDVSFADWQLTAYGKTPTAFMQTDEAAVNLAAVVALRDAGANFVTSFQRVPQVAQWLAGRDRMNTSEGTD